VANPTVETTAIKAKDLSIVSSSSRFDNEPDARVAVVLTLGGIAAAIEPRGQNAPFEENEQAEKLASARFRDARSRSRKYLSEKPNAPLGATALRSVRSRDA
jgi:hypothetical protein